MDGGLVMLALIASLTGAEGAQLPSGRQALRLGDLLLTPEQASALRTSRSITFGTAWTQAQVYYEFSANVSAPRRALARTAMSQWSADTAITLVESGSAANRILVSDVPTEPACGTSFLGMVGGVQDLVIRCWDSRTIVHEFGHALGIGHEHQRSDRGAHIAVNDENGLQNAYPDLWSVSYAVDPGGDIRSAFDYASVMNYGSIGAIVLGGQTYRITLSALGAQPAGAPPGSESFCNTPELCTIRLGQSNASPRDLYGQALRYGRRLDRIDTQRPLDGSLGVSGHIDTCGSHCWRVPAESTVTVSLTPSPGQIAVLSGRDCNVRGSGPVSCVIATTANLSFTAFTLSPAALAAVLAEPPRPPLLFDDGFE